jgi:YVTN family beta-propeller protein
MSRAGTTFGITILSTLYLLGVCAGSSFATRLSPDVTKSAQIVEPEAKVRLDGALQTKDGGLYLLLMPSDAGGKKPVKDKAAIETVFPDKATGKAAEVILYTNGLAHVRVVTKGEASTLAIAGVPEKMRNTLMQLHFPSDLIVPVGFVMPRSMKSLIAEVPTISLLDDAIILRPDFGQKQKPISRSQYKGSGSVFLSSITAGSITMLDGKTLNKVAEFPTEGTPTGMELVNGQLYIVDQAKNRVLILDPAGRKFAGQIDLNVRSAPKGIAALPNGKWMYISESATSDVAVVELETGKVLMRTKVHPGPGRIALTPDGIFLVVLNVTSGEVSVLSTYNQRVVSTLKVGDMPTSLVISPDSKAAYVTNRMSNTVSVIDIPKRQILGTIKSGAGPTAVALSPDGEKLYVACGRDNSVTVYDTKNRLQIAQMHLPVEIEFPGSLCMMPNGKQLLVSGQQGQMLGVINTDKMELERSANLGHANHDTVWVPAP